MWERLKNAASFYFTVEAKARTRPVAVRRIRRALVYIGNIWSVTGVRNRTGRAIYDGLAMPWSSGRAFDGHGWRWRLPLLIVPCASRICFLLIESFAY
jgi:hypothetical protein